MNAVDAYEREVRDLIEQANDYNWAVGWEYRKHKMQEAQVIATLAVARAVEGGSNESGEAVAQSS